MSANTKALFEAALALPETERALLADQLWGSLPPDLELLTDDQVFAELERRHREAENDPAATVPWPKK